jgi:hypothetical protein
MAGEEYVDGLLPHLKHKQVLMKHKSIGERLRYLNR